VTSVGEKEEKTNTIQLPPSLVFFAPSKSCHRVEVCGLHFALVD